MKFYPKPKVIVIGLLLIAGMLRASNWQWERHLEKQAYIAMMDQRLAQPVSPFPDLLELAAGERAGELVHRRVTVSGEFDFDHEIVLRNRRFDDAAGVFVITPLRIAGTDRHVLVSRGFLPLSVSGREERARFRREKSVTFTGLVKASSERRMLAPRDPESGRDKPWVDAWLRVDIPNISRQLPYPVLPVYLEMMGEAEADAAKDRIVTTSAGREELLFMGFEQTQVARPDFRPDLDYPVPVFDTVIPAGRHLGYVYEWATMAFMTFLICMVIQLRPSRRTR